MQTHDIINLRRHDRVIDACYDAEFMAEKHGDAYAIVDTGMGHASVRVADLDNYGIAPWRVLGYRGTDQAYLSRRKRLNAALLAATAVDEQVAS